MNLKKIIESDIRLNLTDHLAKLLYEIAGKRAHNYSHAFWDTEKIAIIVEQEGDRDSAIPIASGLLHDTGVSQGEYKDHAKNSGVIVRKCLYTYGFSADDTEEIAVAVTEHNSWQHSSVTSQYLFDADTLFKAGGHGIFMCEEVRIEFGLSVPEAAQRFAPYFQKLVDQGFYTNTAKAIDQELGNDRFSGLEMTAAYWKKVDDGIRAGNLQETEIIKNARAFVGLENGT